MINFDSDADVFINADEFGVTATFKGEDISVIFDMEADEQEEALLPVLRCKKSDVTGIAYGDTFTIDGQDYGVLNFYDEAEILAVVLNEVN